MNQDARVRQRKPLLGRAPGQQHGGDGSGLADARRDHVRLHKLHSVVNGESRGDRASRRVDIQLNILLRIFRLQKKHLRRCQIGYMIVNGRSDENDVLFEEPRINVVSAFAATGLFDHHGYERCAAIVWFAGIFHLGKYRWHFAGVCFTLHPSPRSPPQRS